MLTRLMISWPLWLGGVSLLICTYQCLNKLLGLFISQAYQRHRDFADILIQIVRVLVRV